MNNLRSTGINIEEWGGDNYFFSMMAGTVCGFKLWKNLGEKQSKGNSYRKNIKGELKFRILKFTPISSLCYKYELYPLK